MLRSTVNQLESLTGEEPGTFGGGGDGGFGGGGRAGGRGGGGGGAGIWSGWDEDDGWGDDNDDMGGNRRNGANGSNGGGGSGGSASYSQADLERSAAGKDDFFARKQTENSNRSSILPPSQGGKYSGFGSGSLPPAKPSKGGWGDDDDWGDDDWGK
jgi:hypothetical protein